MKAVSPSPESQPDVIDRLRTIRDKAWQCGKIHKEFSEIEGLATACLADLGIVDKNPPNPRPHGWWKKEIREH